MMMKRSYPWSPHSVCCPLRLRRSWRKAVSPRPADGSGELCELHGQLGQYHYPGGSAPAGGSLIGSYAETWSWQEGRTRWQR